MNKLIVYFISLFFLCQSSLFAYSSNPKDFVDELVNDAISKLSDVNLNKEQKAAFIAKVALENDEKLKKTDALNKIIEHLNIINNDMLSIFKKNNIEPIKSINEKLDPNLHQAMMEIEDETKEPGTIVQEIQKGFMMKDRLLRPALVGVAKRKPEEQSKEEQKTQENQAEKDKN